MIYAKMNLNKNETTLPVIVVGKGKEEKFFNGIKKFSNNIIASNKCEFDIIKSPIDILIQKEKKLKDICNQYLSIIQNLTNKREQLQSEILSMFDN